MRHTTFRQLEIFASIARNRSFTRAAEELFLTQPTVSMQIKKLTDAVGLALFEQVGKRIHLTQAGEELHATCKEVFDALDRFEMAAAELKGLKRGKLRVAVVSTAKYFAPRVLGPFCLRHPGIDVSLKVTNRERLLTRLQQNEDDLYILGQPPEHIEVEAMPFIRNPLVAFAPAGHPLAGARQVALTRLAQEPFVMREPGSGTRLATERLFESHGLRPRVRMELGSNEAIKQSVAAGLGVSILSQHTLVGNQGELIVLDVEGLPLHRLWYVVYPAGKQLSVVARTFLSYLQNEGRAIGEAALDPERAPAPTHRRTSPTAVASR